MSLLALRAVRLGLGPEVFTKDHRATSPKWTAEYQREYMRKYRKAHKRKRQGKKKRYPKKPGSHRASLLRQYGLTLETYAAMLKAQRGVCAICRCPPSKQSLSVDHDHKTGKVRGLLCWRCNYRLLGSTEDPERLRRAAEYIEKHSTIGCPRLANRGAQGTGHRLR